LRKAERPLTSLEVAERAGIEKLKTQTRLSKMAAYGDIVQAKSVLAPNGPPHFGARKICLWSIGPMGQEQ